MKTFIDKVAQDRLGYFSKLRPESRRKMILMGEIRRGFLEKVALNVALKDKSSTHNMWVRGTSQGKKGLCVKAVWRWQEDEEEL